MSPDSAEPGFEGFYRANFSRLVSQVQGKKRIGFHDAEDIVQASLAELASKWEEAENPGALLATIIHRKVIKHWEQQPFAKGVSVTFIGEEAERLHSRAQDPAVSAEHRDTLRYLGRKLHLEPIEQDIVLGRAEGLTATEIASQTKISTVRVRQAGRQLNRRAAAAASSDPTFAGDLEDKILAHVSRLPRRQRDVMTWTMFGVHPAAIAKVEGITSNDARVNLSHARKALAAMDSDGTLTLVLEALINRRRLVWGSRVPPTSLAELLSELQRAAGQILTAIGPLPQRIFS